MDTNKSSNIEFMDKIPKMLRNSDAIKVLPKGYTLLRKGDAVKYVYYICSGKVRVYDETADGLVERVVWVSSGEPVGEMEMLSEGNVVIYSAKVDEDDTQVIQISKNDFWSCLAGDNEFCMQIAICMAKKLNTAAMALCRHLNSDSLEMVAEYFLDIVGTQLLTCGKAAIAMTRSEIADNCCISERTVNRCVQKLKVSGCLSIGRGKINISREQYAILLNGGYKL